MPALRRTQAPKQKLLRLSPRLAAVAGMVPECSRLIDVGCDHAQLAAWLVKQGICRTALATDLKDGPLAKAWQTVAAQGLQDRISMCRTNGLEGIGLVCGDVVVIAGLGGLEIRDILARAGRRLDVLRAIVLQPQKSLPELRSWLSQQSLRLTEEQLVYDRGRWYIVLRVQPGQNARDQDSLLQHWLGPALLAHQPPAYPAWLKAQLPHLRLRAAADPALGPVLTIAEDLASWNRASDCCASDSGYPGAKTRRKGEKPK